MAFAEGSVAQLRDALLHHHGAHTVVQAVGTPRRGIPIAYEIVVVHRAGAADGQRTAGIQRPHGVGAAPTAVGTCDAGACGIVGEGILVAADAGRAVLVHGADLIDIGFARLVLGGHERGLAAAYPVASVVLPTVPEFLGAKDLIAVRALDGGPVQGKLPVAAYAAGELGGRQHGGGRIVHLGPLQRVVIGADGHGPPTGLTAAEMHGGQRLTAAEGALGDLLNAAGQGHGGQCRAAVEHVPGDLIQPAGQRDRGKGGAFPKCGAAQTLQGVGQGDRLQGAAPRKQVAAGVADAVGNGDAGQLFTVSEHICTQPLHARRQGDGGQVVQLAEGFGADICNTLAHDDLPNLVTQTEPRRRDIFPLFAVPYVSVVVYLAGAGDAQRAAIIQYPPDVVAALAAGHRSGLRGVHQAERQQHGKHHQSQQHGYEPLFHIYSPSFSRACACISFQLYLILPKNATPYTGEYVLRTAAYFAFPNLVSVHILVQKQQHKKRERAAWGCVPLSSARRSRLRNAVPVTVNTAA